MSGKQVSGYCRSMVLIILIMLALCVTAASAATLSDNLVAGKVTQLVTTTAPASATCPSGYECMTEADAAAQLGNYDKSPDGAVCGYKQSTTAVALIRVPQYCAKKRETAPGSRWKQARVRAPPRP